MSNLKRVRGPVDPQLAIVLSKGYKVEGFSLSNPAQVIDNESNNNAQDPSPWAAVEVRQLAKQRVKDYKCCECGQKCIVQNAVMPFIHLYKCKVVGCKKHMCGSFACPVNHFMGHHVITHPASNTVRKSTTTLQKTVRDKDANPMSCVLL